jgi:hypothetical protein
MTDRDDRMQVFPVPFPFEVHGRMLPAGDYRFERRTERAAVIRGETEALSVQVTAVAGRNPGGETSVLVFDSGQPARLAGVWHGRESGHEISSVPGTLNRPGHAIVFASRNRR